MKSFAALGAVVLFLFFGAVVPASAQQEQGKPEGEQEHSQPAEQQNQNNQTEQQHHPQQQNQNKQTQSEKHAQQQNQDKQPQQSQQAQQHYKQQPVHHSEQQEHAQQAAWQQHRSEDWHADHRDWQQRGGYHGYRIPDNRYNGYFGQRNMFVIYSQPYRVVGGYPRFQHGGYWFSVVDPWPQDWSNNWYQTDDVYVVYQNNGYYMYNQRYPGIGLAISVSL